MNCICITVLFSVPSAPVVRIESAGESTAGVNHTLTCTVTLEQDLKAPLLIQWTAPNGSIVGNETLVDVTVSRSSNNLSLTFSPLHTSHGGQYSCMASVNVLKANVSIGGQASLNITVQSILWITSSCTELTFFLLSVPMPSLTITGSPINEGFHTGLLLTFTGMAVFNPAVDTPLTVNGMWTKTNPFSDLTVNSHINITEPTLVQERPMMVYETSLTVDTLDVRRGDSGDYMVRLDISSLSFTTRTTVSHTRSIVVLGNDTSYCTFIKSVWNLIYHFMQAFLLNESVSLLWKWVCPLLVTCTLWNAISVVQLH